MFYCTVKCSGVEVFWLSAVCIYVRAHMHTVVPHDSIFVVWLWILAVRVLLSFACFSKFVICSKLKIWKSDLLIAEQCVWSLASLFILFHLFFNDVNKHWARCSSLHLQHERKAAIKTKAAKLNPGPRRLRQHDEPECALGKINNILNC